MLANDFFVEFLENYKKFQDPMRQSIAFPSKYRLDFYSARKQRM